MELCEGFLDRLASNKTINYFSPKGHFLISKHTSTTDVSPCFSLPLLPGSSLDVTRKFGVSQCLCFTSHSNTTTASSKNLVSACYYLSVPMLPLFYIFRCCIALFQYRNTDFPYRSLSNDYGSLMIQWLTLHQGGPPLRWWTEGHSSIHCKIQRIIKYWLKIKHLPFTWKYLLTFKWKAAEASCRIKTFFAQTLPPSKRCY